MMAPGTPWPLSAVVCGLGQWGHVFTAMPRTVPGMSWAQSQHLLKE